MERNEANHWFENQKIGIKKNFIEELEERATNPNERDSVIEENWPNLIANGEKIPFSKECRELLVRIGQDYRLTPDQIDSLVSEFMENPK